MGGLTAAQWVAIAIAGAGVNEQRISARQQKRASKKAQQSADLRATRERRQVVREARIRRAQILQISANTGAAGSSSELGAIGGIQTQLGEALGASLQTQIFSRQQSSANRAAATSRSRIASLNALGEVAPPIVESIFK